MTDHPALCYAFAKQDTHGRLARWLNFLAECNYTIVYKPGMESKPADFISRASHMEPAIDTSDDEGQVTVITMQDDSEPELPLDLEPFLLDVKSHLTVQEIKTKDTRLLQSAQRAGRSFLV